MGQICGLEWPEIYTLCESLQLKSPLQAPKPKTEISMGVGGCLGLWTKCTTTGALLGLVLIHAPKKKTMRQLSD